MKKRERYLITGASGFLGKILVDSMKKHADIVTLSTDKRSNLEIDISRPFTLESEAPFDVVIHAAGKAHIVPKTQAEADAFFRVNLEGTKNLCNAFTASTVMPQSFIFISTVAVYGLDTGEMIDEKNELKGDSPYAKSKILAEEWLQNWAAKSNVILTILRLPLVAGDNAPGNLGDMIKSIKKRKYLSIGKASARKSIVWAADISALIPLAAKKGGTFNLTDGYHPTIAELENCISYALKKRKPARIPLQIAKILGYAGDFLGKRSPVNSDKIKKLTSTLTFDDSLAVKELNWKPTPVLTKLPSIL